MNRIVGYVLVSVAVVIGGVWVAAQVNLTTFQPGTVIEAEEVNANFEALRDAIASLQAAKPQVYTFSVLEADWDSGLHYGDGNVFHSYEIPASAVGGLDLRTFWFNGGTILVYAQPQPGAGYNEDKMVPHLYSYHTGTEYIGLKIEHIPRRNIVVISKTTNGWDADNMATATLPDQVDFRVVLIESTFAP